MTLVTAKNEKLWGCVRVYTRANQLPNRVARRQSLKLSLRKEENIRNNIISHTRPVKLTFTNPYIYRHAPREQKNHSSTYVKEWLSYFEPGSNRHRFPYRCLRPTRLPIPPSKHLAALVVRTWCKSTTFFYSHQIFPQKSSSDDVFLYYFLRHIVAYRYIRCS